MASQLQQPGFRKAQTANSDTTPPAISESEVRAAGQALIERVEKLEFAQEDPGFRDLMQQGATE